MLTFNLLKASWHKLKTEKSDKLKELVPSLSEPKLIFIKRQNETDQDLVIQFEGLDKAMSNTADMPQIKRAIVTWIRQFSSMVKIMRSDPTVLILQISKEMLGEAAIQVYKRNSNNKIEKYYKCIGGKKDGRRVSDPNLCIGVPDWNKKMQFAISKRAKYGQTVKAKSKTQLTNLVSKRVRKANTRLKKARGF